MSLQALVDRIAELDAVEHDEIAKLISVNEVPFTMNCNGVFVDMASVPDDVIRQIETFVTFCMNNKKLLVDDRFKPYQQSVAEVQKCATIQDVDTNAIVEDAKACLRRHNIYHILFPDNVVTPKRKPHVKRTFVQNTRRTDFYDAQENQLE